MLYRKPRRIWSSETAAGERRNTHEHDTIPDYGNFDEPCAEVSGFISTALVEIDPGMTRSMESVQSNFQLTAASVYDSEPVEPKQKAICPLDLNTTGRTYS
jgi:hypothetical protein